MTGRTGRDPIVDWLALNASRLLDEEDRSALCGDLAECGISGFAAFRDVMSLAIRRQAAELRDYLPWLFVFAMPLGLLLAMVSRRLADGTAIYVWLYADNWNPGLTRMPGFWRGLAGCLLTVISPCIWIVCWSWTAGVLMGSCARRARWIGGAGLLTVLFCVVQLGVPSELGYVLSTDRARDYFGNAVVFSNPFYRSVFPGIVELCLVLAPLLYGMRRCIYFRRLTRVDRVLLSGAFAVAIATLVSQVLSRQFLGLPGWWPLSILRNTYAVTIAVVGSTAYLNGAASRSWRVARRGLSSSGLLNDGLF